MFPPIPSWSGLHPLVIHFPIALLIAAPVFMVMALLVPSHRSMWSAAALIMMVLGTLSVYVAVATGEAAEDGAEFPDGIETVLNRHEALAEQTKWAFTALTLVYGGGLAVSHYWRRGHPHAHFVISKLLFLAIYLAGLLLLVNTAHNGGAMVHDFGVHHPTSTAPPTTQAMTNQPAG